MTTCKFTLGKTGDLQARFHQASRTVGTAIQHQRDLAAQLEAELYLDRLFGDGAGISPQPTPYPPGGRRGPAVAIPCRRRLCSPADQQLGRPSVEI